MTEHSDAFHLANRLDEFAEDAGFEHIGGCFGTTWSKDYGKEFRVVLYIAGVPEKKLHFAATVYKNTEGKDDERVFDAFGSSPEWVAAKARKWVTEGGKTNG